MNTKTFIGLFCTTDRLKHQINWCLLLYQLQSGGHMTQYTTLCGYTETLAYTNQHLQQGEHSSWRIGGRINSNHGITSAIQQSIYNTGCNAFGIIGGMIGLQPNRQSSFQSKCITEP